MLDFTFDPFDPCQIVVGEFGLELGTKSIVRFYQRTVVLVNTHS